MSNPIELSIEPMLNNGRVKGRVTARRGGEVVHMDTFSLDSQRSRQRFLNDLAEAAGDADVAEVRKELLRAVDEQLKQPPEVAAEAAAKPEMSDELREEAMKMLTSPALCDIIADDISRLGVEREHDLSLLLHIVMTSRILPDPIGVIVQGATSAGKSYTVRTVSELIPPESKVSATSLSAHALHYFSEPGRLVHKVLIVGERKQSDSPEAIDENRALRELLSEKRITRLVAVRDPATGKMTTTAFTVEGPIAYVESTTKERIFDEDASRLLPLRVDESKTQTRAVMDRIAREAKGETISPSEREAIIQKHHAAQRLLEEFTDVPVIVPFADGISIPASKIIARRTFKFFIGVVQVVALARVYQKLEVERQPIVADLEDYEIARRLMAPVIRRQLGTLGDAAEDLFHRLQGDYHDEQAFVAADVARLLGVSPRHARRRMAELLDNDLARETDRSRRNRKEWSIPREASVAAVDGLPDAYEVEERLAITHEQDGEEGQE